MTAFQEEMERLIADRQTTVYRLAKKSGVERSTIKRMREGISHPSPEMVEKLSVGFELGPVQRIALFVSAGYIPPDLREETMAYIRGNAGKTRPSALMGRSITEAHDYMSKSGRARLNHRETFLRRLHRDLCGARAKQMMTVPVQPIIDAIEQEMPEVTQGEEHQ